MEYTCPWSLALCGSIREGESKKRNRGLGGKGGITDNILFNYCLNKNIVFLKEKKNNSSQTRQQRKRNEKQTFFLQDQTKKEETKELLGKARKRKCI